MTLALVFLTSCSYDVVKSPAGRGAGPQAAGGIGFDQVYKTSLANNCTSCHANFSSYEAVFSLRDTIAKYVQSGYMPRGKAMPADERTLLLDWIAAGAPRDAATGGGNTPPPTPTPAPTPAATPVPNGGVSFDQVYKTSLATNCVGCHSEFSSYETVYSLRTTIANYVQSGVMPRGSTMPADQKALLLNWIAAGAPRDPSGTTPDPNPVPRPSATPCPDDHTVLEHGDDHKEDHCDKRKLETTFEEAN